MMTERGRRIRHHFDDLALPDTYRRLRTYQEEMEEKTDQLQQWIDEHEDELQEMDSY